MDQSQLWVPVVLNIDVPFMRSCFTLIASRDRSDVDVLVNQIVFEEPLISETRKPHLRRLVHKLMEKLESNESDDFYLFKANG